MRRTQRPTDQLRGSNPITASHVHHQYLVLELRQWPTNQENATTTSPAAINPTVAWQAISDPVILQTGSPPASAASSNKTPTAHTVISGLPFFQNPRASSMKDTCLASLLQDDYNHACKNTNLSACVPPKKTSSEVCLRKWREHTLDVYYGTERGLNPICSPPVGPPLRTRGQWLKQVSPR